MKKALILSGFLSIAIMCSVAALRTLSFVLQGTRVSMACFKSPLRRTFELLIRIQLSSHYFCTATGDCS